MQIIANHSHLDYANISNPQPVKNACMYVCLCKGVTDSQIRQAINDGATSLRALREALDVMTQCGKCGCYTRDLLNQQLNASLGDELFYSAA